VRIVTIPKCVIINIQITNENSGTRPFSNCSSKHSVIRQKYRLSNSRKLSGGWF